MLKILDLPIVRILHVWTKMFRQEEDFGTIFRQSKIYGRQLAFFLSCCEATAYGARIVAVEICYV